MAETVAPQVGAVLWRDLTVNDAGADLPPQWLLYIIVEDVDLGAAACARLGGRIVAGPRPLSGGRFRVIADPAGAVCARDQSPRA